MNKFIYLFNIMKRTREFGFLPIRLWHYQIKSAFAYLLKYPTGEAIHSFYYRGRKVYFRDNWFDSRSVYWVYTNDYTELDPDIFKGIKTFVDVGSNLGYISRCAQDTSSQCKIIMFEPMFENHILSNLNTETDTCHWLAIGNKQGTCGLLVDSNEHMGAKILFEYEQKPKKVKVDTLDNQLKKHFAYETIDLLKIDVEGMEVEVLEGAEETLKRTKKVALEVHSPKLEKQVIEILNKSGFKLKKQNVCEFDMKMQLWGRD